MPLTRDQERAKHALTAAARLTTAEERTLAKKLPVLIQTCGLAQAMAFFRAKGKGENLCKALEEWVWKTLPRQGAGQAGPPQGARILERIVQGNEPDFLFQATAEAQAYLFWIGRFAEAEEKTSGGRG